MTDNIVLQLSDWRDLITSPNWVRREGEDTEDCIDFITGYAWLESTIYVNSTLITVNYTEIFNRTIDGIYYDIYSDCDDCGWTVYGLTVLDEYGDELSDRDICAYLTRAFSDIDYSED